MTRYNPSNVKNLRRFTQEVLANVVQGSLNQVKKQNVVSEDTVHPAAHSQSYNKTERQILESASGGHFSEINDSSDIQKEVFRQARRALELSPDMRDLRNVFENKLLQCYS